jgi:putative transposase
MSNASIFRYFKTSPEIIRQAVMIYVRYPLSLRNVKDVLHDRSIDITHEMVRFWRNRFRTIFAAEILRSRVQAMRNFRHRRWLLNAVFMKINSVEHYLWRAIDHEGEVLESFVTKRRDNKAALNRRSAQRMLQTFAALHGSIHNQFNQECNLISRENFKDRRTAALNEWRQLSAA